MARQGQEVGTANEPLAWERGEADSGWGPYWRGLGGSSSPQVCYMGPGTGDWGVTQFGVARGNAPLLTPTPHRTPGPGARRAAKDVRGAPAPSRGPGPAAPPNPRVFGPLTCLAGLLSPGRRRPRPLPPPPTPHPPGNGGPSGHAPPPRRASGPGRGRAGAGGEGGGAEDLTPPAGRIWPSAERPPFCRGRRAPPG